MPKPDLLMRRLRAFLRAAQIALQGTPPRFRPLERWMNECLRKVARVIAAADVHDAQPDDIQLKLDGRMTSLEQTLDMVRHNMRDVYPRLIRLNDPHVMLVVQSSNMNDQYRVSQFAASDLIASHELKQALAALHQHLLDLPPIGNPPQ